MKPTYEIHPPTLDEFLGMLDERENDASENIAIRGPRSWVYCTGLVSTRSDAAGILYAHRWVQAQFVYGDDLVTWKKTTSNTIEMNMPGDDHRGRQEEAVSDASARIREKMRGLGLDPDSLKDTRISQAGVDPST